MFKQPPQRPANSAMLCFNALRQIGKVYCFIFDIHLLMLPLKELGTKLIVHSRPQLRLQVKPWRLCGVWAGTFSGSVSSWSSSAAAGTPQRSGIKWATSLTASCLSLTLCSYLSASSPSSSCGPRAHDSRNKNTIVSILILT